MILIDAIKVQLKKETMYELQMTSNDRTTNRWSGTTF